MRNPLRGSAADLLPILAIEETHFVTLAGRLGRVLALLLEGGWLAPGALVVVERSSRTPEPEWPAGLELLDERRHGETVLWSAEHVLPAEPGGPEAGVA